MTKENIARTLTNDSATYGTKYWNDLYKTFLKKRKEDLQYDYDMMFDVKYLGKTWMMQ
jgi:hypothetical protein